MHLGFRALHSVKNEVWEKAYKMQKVSKMVMNNVMKHSGLHVPSVTKQANKKIKKTEKINYKIRPEQLF